MPEVEEWTFPRVGGLQVCLGAQRADQCSCTLAVSDIDEHLRKLESMGVDAGAQINSECVRTAMAKNPDGNSIALAEAIDPSLVR